MNRDRTGAAGLYVETGGASSEPTLLLMHGLSGTGAVWSGLRDILRVRWPGRWIIPDMRGHGRSGHHHRYGIGLHAADMADLLADHQESCLVGHSMGGLVGILMASGWFGLSPRAVIALGVKVTWTPEEFAGINKLATAPTRWFETEEQARERFVLVTGLKGLVDPDSQIAGTGVVQQNGRWRLAADNRAAMVAHADTRDIHAAATAPVYLAAGERDQMVPAHEMKGLDPNAVVLPGLGHNAHVEDPEALWALIADRTGLDRTERTP